MSDLLPIVAWGTIATNVLPYYDTGVFQLNEYTLEVYPLDRNEPGADTITASVGDYFIDNLGWPWEILEVTTLTDGLKLRVIDVNERSISEVVHYGPYANLIGYVYRPTKGAVILSQAQLLKLNSQARDRINNIEKGVLWDNGGGTEYWQKRPTTDDIYYDLGNAEIEASLSGDFFTDKEALFRTGLNEDESTYYGLDIGIKYDSSTFQYRPSIWYFDGDKNAPIEKTRFSASKLTIPNGSLEILNEDGVYTAGFSMFDNNSYSRFNVDSSYDLNIRNSSNTQNVLISASGNSYFNGGNIGIGNTVPTSLFELQRGQFFVNGSTLYLLNSKYDSQGSIWNNSTLPSIIFNGTANERPEISWIRGGRLYPEFSIRQHEINDSGGIIYSGNGLSAPTLTLAFNKGNVGIGTSSPSNLLDISKNQNAPTYLEIENINTSGSAESGFHFKNSDGSAYFKGFLAGANYTNDVESSPGNYSFLQSSHTAIHRAADYKFQLNNGSTYMTIDTTGRVTIGDDPNPGYEFGVVRTKSGTLFTGIRNNDPTGQSQITVSTGSGIGFGRLMRNGVGHPGLSYTELYSSDNLNLKSESNLNIDSDSITVLNNSSGSTNADKEIINLYSDDSNYVWSGINFGQKNGFAKGRIRIYGNSSANIGTIEIQGNSLGTYFTGIQIYGNQVGIGGSRDATSPFSTLKVNGIMKVTDDTIFNDIRYSWPGSDGTSGYVLTTDGSGNLTWTDKNAGGGTPGTGIIDINGLNPVSQFISGSSPISVSSSTATHTISISQAGSSTNGYLSSSDWNSFNGKQNALSGTGLVKSTSGSISYIADNSSNWNIAYGHSQDNSQAHSDYLINNGDDSTSGSLTAYAFIKSGGTSSQFLKADGSVDSTSYATTNNYADSLSFNTSNGILTLGRLGLSDLTVDLDGRYLTGLPSDITNISAGSGMNFSTITTGTGVITMGQPSDITGNSINIASGTTHSHNLDIDYNDISPNAHDYLEQSSSLSWDIDNYPNAYFTMSGNVALTIQAMGGSESGVLAITTTSGSKTLNISSAGSTVRIDTGSNPSGDSVTLDGSSRYVLSFQRIYTSLYINLAKYD